MKEKILELRAEGLSYREIQKRLGCSRSTICDHCGEGQREKRIKRRKKYWKRDLRNKIDHFTRDKKYKNNRKITIKDSYLFLDKIRRFNEGFEMKFTMEEFLEKYKDKNIECYITGEPIDITKPRTYQFDHIIPRAKGGNNSLENLGICTKQANMAKYDMNYEEFIEFCRKAISHYDLKNHPRDSKEES